MRVFGMAVVAAAVALVLAASASAAKPIHSRIDDTFTFDGCGFEVTGHAVGVDNFSPIFDADGNIVSFWDTAHVTTTFTANGKSLVEVASGRHTGTAVGSFDGLVTFTDTFKGLPEKLMDPNGGVLSRDAGVAVFETVFDFSNNPDGEFVSQTVTVEKGPHPELDSNFELFCQIINEQLG